MDVSTSKVPSTSYQFLGCRNHHQRSVRGLKFRFQYPSSHSRVAFRHPNGTLEVLPIIVNLAPNQSADLSVDVLFEASDVYQLAAIVDSASEVEESDEGNNVRTLDVTVTTAPQSG